MTYLLPVGLVTLLYGELVVVRAAAGVSRAQVGM
jgi:hypothetical protein